ncbi:hypothetical protein FRC08_018380 [Ceratobasidium sp. 394]|nr:hypothetical protein FRC08_018380 [Ceratobasidium sp. 394]
MSHVYELESWTPKEQEILQGFMSALPADGKGLSIEQATALTTRLFPEGDYSDEPKQEPAVARFSSESHSLGYVASPTRTFSARVTAWNEPVLKGDLFIYESLDGPRHFRMFRWDFNGKPVWFHVWTVNPKTKASTSHFQAKVDFPLRTEVGMGVWHGTDLSV